MNRRRFLKRAIGMAAVVAGLTALPKDEAKAVPAETQADVLRRIVTPTPAARKALGELGYDPLLGTAVTPTRAFQTIHMLPIIMPSREEQALYMAQSAGLSRTESEHVVKQSLLALLDTPSREEQALEQRITLNQDALSKWAVTMDHRAVLAGTVTHDNRVTWQNVAPLPAGVVKTHNPDGGITVEFRG